MKIMWLNPVPKRGNADDRFERQLNGYALAGTEVEVRYLGRGPRHLEYAYYGALVLSDTMHLIKQAENDGIDGAVIGCFYDPGLVECREIIDKMMVTAPMEASLHLACALGNTVSILIGRRKWIPFMRETVARYGLSQRLASFRDVGLGVLEFNRDPERTAELLEREARLAVEDDGAEVIILGCTATHGFYRHLQEQLGVPVVDPVLAALDHVQRLVQVRDNFGWSHSKRGMYETPPIREIRDWGLESAYDLGTVWRDSS